MKKKVLAIVIALVLLTAMVTSASAGGKQANPTSVTVKVDGRTVEFDAYIIDGNNYFKLRDLAYTLNGTAKQFSIEWDGDSNAISLTGGQAYEPVGGEMVTKSAGVKTARPTSSRIYLDGKEVFFTAYNIEYNNYFKLRDIGRAFDFGVTWDNASKTFVIDTSTHYTEDKTYTNIYFDYTAEIAAFDKKNTGFTTPPAADIGITVEDEKGATGVVLVASEDSAGDYYLNALVAGNALTFSGDIKAAAIEAGGKKTELTVEGGKFTITPQLISAANPVDEIITITKNDGTPLRIHTVNNYMPVMHITMDDKVKPEPGVYSFLVDDFLLRIDTDGNIVYYRNLACVSNHTTANFRAYDTSEGRFYTYFVELNPALAGLGYVSGMFVLMDENYREIDYITLLPNDDKNHTHGEGYLDEHEFVLLGRNHWISLSYTKLRVSNLPSGGIDGGSEAYVQAGIIQEVKDGKVIHEYNTVDYPELYAAAKENSDYENSSGDAAKDYVHINSIFIDPKDGNLIVSMRSQYAVCKFDRETGDILWILGGDLNQFSGLDSFKEEDGNLFIGQHDAKYVPAAIAGNDSTVTVFDNQTNFFTNTTRIFIFTLDEARKTATARVINGIDLDELTEKRHWATHCASFDMQTKDSCVIGWGSSLLNMSLETIPTHALLSDYNIEKNVITFELCVERNIHYADSSEPCFNYRVYKNAY